MPSRDYSEKEVNEVILRRYDDYCLIRRDLIIFGYMTRHRGTYQPRPRDQWRTLDWRHAGARAPTQSDTAAGGWAETCAGFRITSVPAMRSCSACFLAVKPAMM